MKPTGWRELLPTFLVVAVVVYLITRITYGVLPPLPLFAGVTLLLLAIIETILGYSLKARIEQRPGTQPVQPLVAARAVALAKASAVAGALMAGVWAGLLGYLLPRYGQLAAAADDTPGAVLGLVCALALVAAALWLQHCCRAPTDSDDPDREHQGR
ncbi:MAG TPA: DUF3180 domain-containing protein [Pseudonocardia sp.]|uniref:DUF3180 domain-containing protein n=1 Tax=Pseudonocardia sp. TaxID=60912 RepID=UPI002CE72E98|nr:DUF3180 domain-containing protein [Pseudonocardia sp.]HTF45894.1 DUF3180 domain-containing protein [Pseudonocardia sp.]